MGAVHSILKAFAESVGSMQIMLDHGTCCAELRLHMARARGKMSYIRLTMSVYVRFLWLYGFCSEATRHLYLCNTLILAIP